ncbi:Uncharacterised protein [Shigella sonnei]|nr:Uncharacterised protein [Shigella sonnei]CSQ76439.1 Uncharacterised protein [Shigella sonnei]
MNRRLRTPVQTILECKLITCFYSFFWLPEADNVIQRFARCWDFHQADGALTPLVTRFHPQTWAFVIPAHNVLIMGEVTIQLQ